MTEYEGCAPGNFNDVPKVIVATVFQDRKIRVDAAGSHKVTKFSNSKQRDTS